MVAAAAFAARKAYRDWSAFSFNICGSHLVNSSVAFSQLASADSGVPFSARTTFALPKRKYERAASVGNCSTDAATRWALASTATGSAGFFSS